MNSVNVENAKTQLTASIREKIVKLKTIANSLNPGNPLISRADVLDILNGDQPIFTADESTEVDTSKEAIKPEDWDLGRFIMKSITDLEESEFLHTDLVSEQMARVNSFIDRETIDLLKLNGIMKGGETAEEIRELMTISLARIIQTKRLNLKVEYPEIKSL